MLNSVFTFGDSICDGLGCSGLFILISLVIYGPFVLGGLALCIAIYRYLRHHKVRSSLAFAIIGLILVSIPFIYKFHQNRSINHAQHLQVQNIDFQTYALSSTLKHKSRYLSDLRKSNAYLTGNTGNGSYEQPTYTYLIDEYDSQDKPVYVRQFNATKYSQAVDSCTPMDPEFYEYTADGDSCEQVALTTQHTPIYAAIYHTSGEYGSVSTQIGSTRITVQPRDLDTLSNQELVKLLQSVQSIDKNKLKFFY